MFKIIKSVFFVSLLIIVFSFQTAAAEETEWWDAKQQAFFKKTGLKPGDVIGKDNYKKVEGLIPPEIVDWLHPPKEYIELKISKVDYDLSIDSKWLNESKLNKGKFGLTKNKNLMDADTGEPSLYVYGMPFPDLDIKNDPDGAAKYMFNRRFATNRFETWEQPFFIEWIGEKGLERYIKVMWLVYNYRGIRDKVPNKSKFTMTNIINITVPYNMNGMAQLALRKADATEDEVFTYVPAIRRVKRMSGANRSDPYMGSEFTIDDGHGWSGLNSSMKWKFLGEVEGLTLIEEYNTHYRSQLYQRKDGGWQSPENEIPILFGYEVEGCKWAKWAPINIVWVPRTFYIIEAIPHDKYYSYARSVYWIDKETFTVAYKIVWNRAKEHWKTSLFVPYYCQWRDRKAAQSMCGQALLDEKTGHATIQHANGFCLGSRVYRAFDTPAITPETFTVGRLSTFTK